MDLIYKKDKNGKDILCNEDERHQIMMEWEKPYMEKSIELLNPFGKVLEIGFGMGYSATKICSFKNVMEYNVISFDRFKKFKKLSNLCTPLKYIDCHYLSSLIVLIKLILGIFFNIKHVILL